MIKARPTSRELNSCRDQHSCQADPRADLRSLHSGQPDTRVDTRPRSSLSVGLVYDSDWPVAILLKSVLFPC